MSSLRRKRASRANGRLSRGPVTPEGKHRSSQNAVAHGLLSDCIVLPGESLEGFDVLLHQHLDRFAPADGVEQAMVEEMAAANWRLRRAWTMETKMLSDAIETQTGQGNRSRITGAFRQLASSPELALLFRYETRLHMMYQRALHNILLLRDIAPSSGPPVDPEHPVAPQSSGGAPHHHTTSDTPAPSTVNASPLRPVACALNKPTGPPRNAEEDTPPIVVPAQIENDTPAPSVIVAAPPHSEAKAAAELPQNPAIPNEPNPTSEHRIESRNRRRLWWRKHSRASRSALARVPILPPKSLAVTLP